MQDRDISPQEVGINVSSTDSAASIDIIVQSLPSLNTLLSKSKYHISSPLNEDCNYVDIIGIGGFSSVAELVSQKGRRYAAKFASQSLEPNHEDYKFAQESLERDQQIHSKLMHPNIVPYVGPVRATYSTNGIEYVIDGFATQICGDSLQHAIWDGKQFSTWETIEIMKDIAKALSYMHSEGLVHRDVKPGNIIIAEGSSMARLIDFGNANTVGAFYHLGEQDADQFCGEPGYMDPRVFQDFNREQLSQIGLYKPFEEKEKFQSEQFSLGVLAWELLTGSLPFPGARDERKVSNPGLWYYPEILPNISNYLPINPDLEYLVKQLLGPTNQRLPDMEAVVQELEYIQH